MALDVGIVDDNAMWLKTLCDTVEQGDFRVTIRETSVPAFYSAVEVAQPDIVLVDMRMPPSNEDEGITVAHTLRERYPTMGIAIVSGLEDPLRSKFIESKLSGGTARPIGFLYKDRLTPDSLHRDLVRIAAGDAVVDSTIASDAINSIVASQRSELTEQEERFMGYVAQGWRDDRIATALSMSSATVERLGRRTFDKLLGDQGGRENRRVRAAVEWLRRRGDL